MASKANILTTIVQELRIAQTAKWKPPASGPVNRLELPPSIPIGNGRQLRVTEALLDSVSRYAALWLENHSSLRPRFKVDELTKLAQRAFGKILHTVELDQSDAELVEVVGEEVAQLLSEWIDQHHRAVDLTLGCHLLKGDDAYPTRIGPVLFETREQWRLRSIALGRLSPVTARRLDAHWNGKPPKKRKPSFDGHAERAVLDAVGTCPVICTVETNGLSGKYVQEKGLLTARIAMMAIALMWDHPSEGLKWMHLHYDRRVFHRHTVLFGEGTSVGSNSEISHLPEGRWTDGELIANLRSYQPLFDPIGEALFRYVQPTKATARPKIMDALFLSLWWFHEACREPLDQIATTKFAASMDALVVGQSANDIIRFIGARLGPKPDDKIMKDGRTTKEAINKIYSASRSRLIHGNSSDFSHDWTQVRSTAEAIGRWCLVEACDWLAENVGTDDLAALSIR
ncbi:hypothetical protein [Blastomonas fulva]|uniref:hypothetical protein n=1 Tax=Blastomonas fulva TaxID=1550728 RepID=UPI003F72C1D5